MLFFDQYRASALQKKLSELVDTEYEPTKIDLVVGLDLSYVGDVGIAIATLHKYPDMSLVKYAVASDEVHVPYIPGLLAFREAPLMFAAYELLDVNPDLILVNGHGITHPRSFGIASHVGVVLDKPTVGIARKILSGREVVINGERYLENNGVLGAYVVVRGVTKTYLSIGHKVSLRFIVRISPKLFKNHELPEPIYTADRISKQVRSKIAHSA
ncbi:MAG: endonuclease V [Desulfurococcaceae archaeon TW002]